MDAPARKYPTGRIALQHGLGARDDKGGPMIGAWSGSARWRSNPLSAWLARARLRQGTGPRLALGMAGLIASRAVLGQKARPRQDAAEAALCNAHLGRQLRIEATNGPPARVDADQYQP